MHILLHLSQQLLPGCLAPFALHLHHDVAGACITCTGVFAYADKQQDEMRVQQHACTSVLLWSVLFHSVPVCSLLFCFSVCYLI